MMKHKLQKNLALRIVCAILAALLVLTGAELLYSNFALTVSRYSVQSEKVTGAFRVVFLTDLHGREFGAGNSRLLKRIAAEEPDLIALAGDIFNYDADDDEIHRTCRFIQGAAKIAPVYFSLGNHEQAFAGNLRTDLLEPVRESGATVLICEFADVEIRGTPVRIGGNTSYYRQPGMTIGDAELRRRELAFADAFEATDRFKLLLDHIPTTWLDWAYIDDYPVDLVLSGHYHGGLIRIPFLDQGLAAPYVGWLPPYTKGIFTGGRATCVLTTGLAGSRLPRFFNPPEIAVVDISGYR